MGREHEPPATAAEGLAWLAVWNKKLSLASRCRHWFAWSQREKQQSTVKSTNRLNRGGKVKKRRFRRQRQAAPRLNWLRSRRFGVLAWVTTNGDLGHHWPGCDHQFGGLVFLQPATMISGPHPQKVSQRDAVTIRCWQLTVKPPSRTWSSGLMNVPCVMGSMFCLLTTLMPVWPRRLSHGAELLCTSVSGGGALRAMPMGSGPQPWRWCADGIAYEIKPISRIHRVPEALIGPESSEGIAVTIASL